MTQKISPFVESKYGWNFGESGWNSGMDENLLKFSFMFDGNVTGIVPSLPPVSNGIAYFLTSDNRFYFGVNDLWYSSPCPKNFIFKIKDSGDFYQFNGNSVIQIDNPIQIGTQLDTIELTISSLGSAAFEDVSNLVTVASLDVLEASFTNQVESLSSSVEERFEQELAAAGFTSLGSYAAGLNVVSLKDYFKRDGRFYSSSVSTVLPYSTTGNWATDSANLVLLGDNVLRQELANPEKGAAMVARGVVAVDSIADLLALPDGQRREGLRYLVSSYHGGWAIEVPYIGPRGGGDFEWLPSSTVAEDKGLVFSVPGVTTGRFHRIHNGVNDITEFGARGNGITNDTDAIIRARDAGYSMHIPEGNFLYDGMSINKNNFTITTDGYARSKLIMSSAPAVAIDVASESSVSGLEIQGLLIQGNIFNLGGIKLGSPGTYAGKVRFKALFIDGFSNPAAGAGYAIQLYANQNTDMENIWTQHNKYGLYRANGGYCTSTRIYGKDTYLGLALHGVYIDGQIDDLYIEDAVIEGNDGTGIVVTPQAANLSGDGRGCNVWLDKCYFEENMMSGVGEAAAISVKGNSFGLAQHRFSLSRCQFAENPAAEVIIGTTAKNVTLDRVLAKVADTNILPNSIVTTANCSVLFDFNIIPSGADMAAQYRSLPGNILVRDFARPFDGTSLDQFNFQNSLTFPAQSRPVTDPNTLDDYREGTFSPVVSGQGGSISSSSGRYTKIGNRVYFDVVLAVSGFSSTWLTTIIELPFTVSGPSTGTILNAATGNTVGGFYVSVPDSLLLPTFASVSGTLVMSGSYQTAI